MRLFACSAALLITAVGLTPAVNYAQDADRVVADGGIKVAGWMGTTETPGQTVNNARLGGTAKELQVTTGPAITYWNPANTASGNYTVKASFTEPKYMNLNDHPHPYGIVIAGNDMGTPNQSYLYCAAYGNGVFIVRGFGPQAFQLNGRRGAPAPSVNRAAGRGSPVTQEIALSVKGDTIECTINGAVVGTYEKAKVVGSGQLKSTDGVYGIRFAHNTEGTVTNLSMMKN